jgi:protein transport protein SEC31
LHEFISKIARLAFSKAAAFCYAVAVGVAGNLAFNFVQHHQTTVPPAVSPASQAASAGDESPIPMYLSPPQHRPAGKPVATSRILPPPSGDIALPSSDSLPTPELKPTALATTTPADVPPQSPPTSNTTALPSPVDPAPMTMPTATPVASNAAMPRDRAPSIPAFVPHQPVTAAVAAPRELPADPHGAATLPPLGAPIEVSAPPNPPAATVLPVATADSVGPTTVMQQPLGEPGSQPLALSDLWHPTRAVEKSLHWAGAQLPSLGHDGKTPSNTPPLRAPISLLPSSTATTATISEAAGGAPSKPVKPGPGSGGLY